MNVASSTTWYQRRRPIAQALFLLPSDRAQEVLEKKNLRTYTGVEVIVFRGQYDLLEVLGYSWCIGQIDSVVVDVQQLVHHGLVRPL